MEKTNTVNPPTAVTNANMNAIGDDGYTPLIRAIRDKKSTIKINNLIEKGADVNIKSQSQYGGGTPLMYAIANKNIEIANLLIEKGADVNANDKEGNTALDIAKRTGQNEMFRLLEQVAAKSKVSASVAAGAFVEGFSSPADDKNPLSKEEIDFKRKALKEVLRRYNPITKVENELKADGAKEAIDKILEGVSEHNVLNIITSEEPKQKRTILQDVALFQDQEIIRHFYDKAGLDKEFVNRVGANVHLADDSHLSEEQLKELERNTKEMRERLAQPKPQAVKVVASPKEKIGFTGFGVSEAWEDSVDNKNGAFNEKEIVFKPKGVNKMAEDSSNTVVNVSMLNKQNQLTVEELARNSGGVSARSVDEENNSLTSSESSLTSRSSSIMSDEEEDKRSVSSIRLSSASASSAVDDDEDKVPSGAAGTLRLKPGKGTSREYDLSDGIPLYRAPTTAADKDVVDFKFPKAALDPNKWKQVQDEEGYNKLKDEKDPIYFKEKRVKGEDGSAKFRYDIEKKSLPFAGELEIKVPRLDVNGKHSKDSYDIVTFDENGKNPKLKSVGEGRSESQLDPKWLEQLGLGPKERSQESFLPPVGAVQQQSSNQNVSARSNQNQVFGKSGHFSDDENTTDGETRSTVSSNKASSMADVLKRKASGDRNDPISTENSKGVERNTRVPVAVSSATGPLAPNGTPKGTTVEVFVAKPSMQHR
jgi:hypothetical protein